MKLYSVILFALVTACEAADNGEPAPACRWISVQPLGYPSEPFGKPCFRVESFGGGVVREAGSDVEAEAVEIPGNGRIVEVLSCDGVDSVVRVGPCR